MSEILRMRQVTKKFNTQYALRDVSLTIKKGEVYGLIGRNGAGKTTLLKTITRLTIPSNGTVSLFSSQTSGEWTNGLKRTGNVIEMPVAYDQLTAEQNLNYYCKLRGIVNAKKVVKETLELVDLADTGKKKFKNFSLGMKQKLGIAIAILSKPDFLILDEPINGLDPIAIVEFRRLIRRLNEEYGMTIIISSHILTELYHVATRFGIIHDGELIQELSKEDFDHQSNEYIVLQSSDIEQASQILNERYGYRMKVVEEDKLHIFGEANDINPIIKTLVEKQIVVHGIYYSKQNLEKYFTDLISLNQEEVQHA